MIERLILFFLPNKYTNCKQNASVALAVGKKAKNEHSIYAGYTGNASSIQPLGAGVKEGRWREMGRRSWNNKSQPSETIGFWKIKCKCCGNEMVFLINPKTLPHSNSRIGKHLLKGYLAEKLR